MSLISQRFVQEPGSSLEMCNVFKLLHRENLSSNKSSSLLLQNLSKSSFMKIKVYENKSSFSSYHNFKHVFNLSCTLWTASLEAAAWAQEVSVVNSEQLCSVCLVISGSAAYPRTMGMAVLMKYSQQMYLDRICLAQKNGWKIKF